MKKKILFITLFILSISNYSQDLSNRKADSLISVLESIIDKKISEKSRLISKDFNEKNKIIENKLITSNKLIDKFNLISDNSSKKIDSLFLNINELNIRLTELIETYNSNLNNEISSILKTTDSLNNKTELLNNDLLNSNSKISQNSSELVLNKTNISTVSEDLDNNERVGTIVISLAILLILIVYIILTKRWNNETKKLSVKQKEILEKQIEDSQKIADWFSESSNESFSSSSNNDHSFAKRVADEIVRISTNLSRMDENIKGHKQLSASVRKLIQTLNVNEYEIAELLNKPYSSGMNLDANFVFDENIPKGSQIITRIIKPQINYKGKLIQAAQIEVSQNE